ncbi:hypothetical protein GCM10011611_21400 [Aliidongia dinghuensis]|uniref:DUF4399 domain-containing protein n=1 Tax=Aliidongia dinghuensis TaxID=1867774 RepID=A0A8J2YSF8_9PROT|nr:DUF4399 domain-containing protein [Aliidongia dinghuensis]GGF15343.1 hypothetical protein GCM10011611_21400 [Aliidongia dinghuensis]
MRAFGPLACGLAIAATLLPAATLAQSQGHEHQTAATAAGTPAGHRTPAPSDAYVYIGWPNDGERLHTRHIKVWFGTRNFGVAPAGIEKPNTGHHHLLIDVDLPPLDQEIPNDKNHLHFGAGQTETYIDLPPGKHTLQLLMGDANHIPHNPPLMSKKITIYVE